jgi:hypothetical protein
VPVLETLPSFGRTLLTGVGVDKATIDTEVIGGTVISAALA